MSRTLLTAVLFSASMAGLPALTGCDRTVDHTSEVKTKADGSKMSTDSKTTEKPDGTIVHTEEKKVDNK